MNGKIKKQALAMILATATMAMVAVAAPAKKKVVSIPKVQKIAFIVNGHLKTQAINGKIVRASTEAEKKQWRSPALVSAVSPNGKLQVRQVATPGSRGDQYTSFEVVQRDTENVVFSAEKLADIIHFALQPRVGLIFDCWLPDSQHIAVVRRDGTSSGPEYYRYVINVNTGNALRFNGWIAPNGKSAIVPDKEYDLNDAILMGNNTISMPEKDSTHNGIRKWYVAQLPNGYIPYSFRSVSKRIITGAGSWNEPVFVGPNQNMGYRRVNYGANAWFRFTSFVLSKFADTGERELALKGQACFIHVNQPLYLIIQ